jgi:hypothetical protein
MPARNNPNAEAQTYRPPEDSHATDTQRLLNTLDRVFSAFREQLRTEEPKPFTGNAKIAADTFNDILAGLKFESRRPGQFQLQARRVSPTEIDLTWTDARADSYRVERCEGHDCEDFDEIASQLPSTQRSFRDTNVPQATFLRYRVVAVDARGETASNIVGVGAGAAAR